MLLSVLYAFTVLFSHWQEKISFADNVMQLMNMGMNVRMIVLCLYRACLVFLAGIVRTVTKVYSSHLVQRNLH